MYSSLYSIGKQNARAQIFYKVSSNIMGFVEIVIYSFILCITSVLSTQQRMCSVLTAVLFY